MQAKRTQNCTLGKRPKTNFKMFFKTITEKPMYGTMTISKIQNSVESLKNTPKFYDNVWKFT